MKTIDIASTAANDVTDKTLRTVVARVVTLVTYGNEAPMRASLLPVGWQAGAEEGWALIHALGKTHAAPPASDGVAEAIAGCEEWQATGLVRARAMLQLRCPEQSAFMFHDFVPEGGAAALLNVVSFLHRHELLDKGSERKETRKADHDALAVLEAAGVTKAVLKDLGALVATAQTVVDDAMTTASQDTAAAARDLLLRKMHAWLTAWSEIARTVITRRDELIKLGLAKRRAKKAKAPATPPVVAPITPPVVVAPPIVVAPPVATPPVATPPVATPPVATPPAPAPMNQLGKIAAQPDDVAPASRAA